MEDHAEGSYFLSRNPTDIFDLVELLGEGWVFPHVHNLFILIENLYQLRRSYGAVYKGIHKETREELAIKIIPSEEDVSQLEQEIDFLQRLKSPYVVAFIEGYLHDNELWVRVIFMAVIYLSS